MRRYILIILVQSFIIQIFGQSDISFHPPLKIPMYLSGNFGEIRSDHFHSGIDIKTQGITGHHVYSIEEGFISRIKVQANGYGKSIYITHPNGYTSVYGHLDKYRDDIAKYVETLQYKRRSFMVNLYLKPDQFLIGKGDFIAFSGNSGSSSGPHLHFEIRSANNQHPTNVLQYGFDIVDNISPKFISLHIEPLSTDSHVNGSADKLAIANVKDKGGYTVPYGTNIKAFGTIGISVEVFDYLNGASNRCGVYTLDFFADNELIYSHKMDEFSFSETRYINAHIDYGERIRSGLKIHRLYRLPNDRLRIYAGKAGNNALKIEEDKVYNMRVVATDVAGNSSTLNFRVTGQERLSPSKHLPAGFVKTMKYNVSNTFVQKEVSVEIPSNALYQDLDFTFKESSQRKESLTPVFQLASPEVPVHAPYVLSIKTSVSDPNLLEKLLLIGFNDENEIEPEGGEYQNGAVTTTLRSFGSYTLALDTIAPRITPVNGPMTGNITGKKSLKFIIQDDLSGIEKYEGYIDNRWVLFEYDLKNDVIIYTFDNERITNGTNHELELFVSDAKGNVNLFHTTFTW